MSDVSPLFVYLDAYVDKMTLHQLGDAAVALERLTPEELTRLSVVLEDGKRVNGLEAVDLIIETLLRISHKAKASPARRWRWL